MDSSKRALRLHPKQMIPHSTKARPVAIAGTLSIRDVAVVFALQSFAEKWSHQQKYPNEACEETDQSSVRKAELVALQMQNASCPFLRDRHRRSLNKMLTCDERGITTYIARSIARNRHQIFRSVADSFRLPKRRS